MQDKVFKHRLFMAGYWAHLGVIKNCRYYMGEIC